MAGPTSNSWTGSPRPVSASELLRRVRARGGDLRVSGTVVQYRPASALTLAELDWLREHRGDIVRALNMPDPDNADAFRGWLRRRFGGDYARLGVAGPGVPAWTPIPCGLPDRHAHSGWAPNRAIRGAA